jgi:SNF2 family DNA or RNA helicase
MENKGTTSIVVCPSTLVLNWKAEVEKWCNSMKVLVVKGNALEREKLLEEYKNYDLIITSYDLLKRDVDCYENKNFKYIIADEAQYIKNSTTQNATSLKSLKGETRFALTGTPIENSVAELWSIFDFIMPGYLYNYNKFRKKFEEPILKDEDVNALNRLKKLISPFILRRVKNEVLTELPEKNITVMRNEMEKEQQKIYLSYLAQTKKEVADEINGNGFEKSKLKILMLLTRLRQICCHPSLFIENYKGESGKLKQCIDLVEEAIEAGHKILIFSSYTSMFEIIEKELNKIDIEYFKLIGKTPVSERIKMVDEFNNSDNVKVFLISLKAGGTGLNLTSADVVIHFDPWWNVSSENQATDRAYRMGQKNSVQVYKLITSNSIEEKINAMQEKKEKLSKDILSTEETFINKLSKEDILDLFE